MARVGTQYDKKNLIKHVTVKIYCRIFTPSQKTLTKFLWRNWS